MAIFALTAAALALLLTACGGGSPTPPAGGPEAVINSPLAGSQTAGTFFFSVQALDPSAVASVRFEAGGTSLGVDNTAADGFRTFVAAADHRAGALELRAVVSGKDGRTTTLTRSVINVPLPPSSASVANDGAALGTTEEDGSLSALIVPPGGAVGADISFEAMTQGQVLAATGVDYDALGITFLGAQDVAVSSGDVDRTLGVSSGGYGPQVQPAQSVVNYLIGPDENGDGVGEIYVVNTASVAPNGDVVSDPVPVAQVGTTASVSQAGSSRLAPLAAGVDGAPGTVISIPVAGFNPAALYGNVAEFDHADGIVQRYGRIVTSEAGAQSFVVQIPPLRPGHAGLTLRNLGSGYASEPIDVQITSAKPVSGSSVAVIENTLDLAQDMLTAFDVKLAATGAESAVAAGMPIIDRVRANLAIMTGGGRPEDTAMITALAARIVASGVDALLTEVHGDLLAGSSVLRAQQAGCNPILDRAEQGMDMVNTLTDLGGYDPPGGDTVADMHSYAFDSWWTWVKNTTLGIDEALGGNACKPGQPAAAGPGAKATPSGMGAAVPAGGNMGGSALPPGFRPIPDYSKGLAPLATELARGRFVISVSVSGSPVPFKGTTDAGGYFMVPMIPTGQPFVAVALDTVTGENRVATGVGPALTDGVFVVFDFSSGESQVSEARWDGGGDGRLWRDARNWEGDLLPLPNSDVLIPASAGTVELDNASGYEYRVMINSLGLAAGATLELSRGTLEILNASTVEGDLFLTNGIVHLRRDLTMNGDTTWYAGAIAGTAAFINHGTMTVDPDRSTNSRTLRGTLRNHGTVVLQGNASSGMRTEQDATLVNEIGGTFEVRGIPEIRSGGGEGDRNFDNRGTIRKTGPGESYWTGFEVNHLGGTVEVQEGTLWFAEGSTSTGATWEVEAEAVLALGSHTRINELTGHYSGTGDGVVRLAGGRHFSVGEVGATFDLTVGGVEWVRSEITGPGTLINTGLLHIVRAANAPALTGSLENRGTVVLRGTVGANLANSNGATILNQAGANIEFHDDQGIGYANEPLHLTNLGSLLKIGGVGVSTLQVCFSGTQPIDPDIRIVAPGNC